MKSVISILAISCFLGIALPGVAQKHHSGKSRYKKEHTTQSRAGSENAQRQNSIPEKASLHPKLKKRPKVVIVPAPPPPGVAPDPVPPKRP